MKHKGTFHKAALNHNIKLSIKKYYRYFHEVSKLLCFCYYKTVPYKICCFFLFQRKPLNYVKKNCNCAKNIGTTLKFINRNNCNNILNIL